MSLTQRMRAAWQYLGALEEAFDHDPLDDLHLRIERLEKIISSQRSDCSGSLATDAPRRAGKASLDAAS